MIDEIKVALGTQQVSTALIIDDLYDTAPKLGHIDPDSWTNLLADLKRLERGLIDAAFPGQDIDATWEALTTNQAFLDLLWAQRSQSKVFEGFFTEYESKTKKGLADLKILQDVLETTLGIAVTTAGSTSEGEVADLVFMDLFLGPAQDAASMRSAIARVKDVLARRADRPPMVVLMSSSTRLEEERRKFRNDAELLSCQFRVLNKTEIKALDPVLDVVHRLVTRYVDTLRVASFVSGWQAALAEAAKVLVRRMRRLDLRDYADLQSLILDAEDEGMGGYLLDLYNRVFQYELEGYRPLAALAAEIDKIEWDDYPPPHFLPAEDGMDILDNVMFHHAEAITAADPVSLGDVLFRVETPAAAAGGAEAGGGEAGDAEASGAEDVAGEAGAAAAGGAEAGAVEAGGAEAGGAEAVGTRAGAADSTATGPDTEVPKIDAAKFECLALMVMTQACDIQRGDVSRYLLLPGVARPSKLQHHKRPGKLTTPVLNAGDGRTYVVEWMPETGAFTFTAAELDRHLSSGRFRRMRRFRTVYALQLQQEFATKLTRVGTIAVPPIRHAVGVAVYFRAYEGTLSSLLKLPLSPEKAVALVGRDGNKEKHHFAMSPLAVAELRSAMLGVNAALLAPFHKDMKAKWQKMLASREVSKALENGVLYNIEGPTRPFKTTDEDVIEIVGPFAQTAPKAGSKWTSKALVILHLTSSDADIGDDGTDDGRTDPAGGEVPGAPAIECDEAAHRKEHAADAAGLSKAIDPSAKK